MTLTIGGTITRTMAHNSPRKHRIGRCSCKRLYVWTDSRIKPYAADSRTPCCRDVLYRTTWGKRAAHMLTVQP